MIENIQDCGIHWATYVSGAILVGATLTTLCLGYSLHKNPPKTNDDEIPDLERISDELN